MRRSLIVLGAAFLLLFGAVAVWKQNPEQHGPDRHTKQQATDERERVHAFWQRYREATAHRLAGRREAALEAYRQALALDPQHEDALYYLGNVHLERGAHADAARAWKRLAALNPRSSRAHLRLGDLYLCHAETSWRRRKRRTGGRGRSTEKRPARCCGSGKSRSCGATSRRRAAISMTSWRRTYRAWPPTCWPDM